MMGARVGGGGIVGNTIRGVIVGAGTLVAGGEGVAVGGVAHAVIPINTKFASRISKIFTKPHKKKLSTDDGDRQ